MLPNYSPPFGMVDLDNVDLPWVSEQAVLSRMTSIIRFNGLGTDILRHGLATAALLDTDDPELKAQAVLHDAQEIVIGDIMSPIKKFGPAFGAPAWYKGGLDLLEYRIQSQIMEMMGVPPIDEAATPLIGTADAIAGLIEAKMVYPASAFEGKNEHCWPGYSYSREEVRAVGEMIGLNNHQAIDMARTILREARHD